MSTTPWPTLDVIAEAVRACQKCRLCQGRTNAVPGEGSPSAALMFIGEGPGFNEDQQGRPFVGRAGKLLDDMFSTVPLKREDVYITNVVKCRPPDNREPQPDEVEACWPYLEAQIALLKPRVIATLGRHSLGRFFPDSKISRDHGRILRWREHTVFPLYHPAAALRSGAVMEALAADFRKLPQAILKSLRAAPSSAAGGPVPTPMESGRPLAAAAGNGETSRQPAGVALGVAEATSVAETSSRSARGAPDPAVTALTPASTPSGPPPESTAREPGQMPMF
jgi:DNA polymerase